MVQPLDNSDCDGIMEDGSSRSQANRRSAQAVPQFKALDQQRLYVAIARQIASQIRDLPLPPGSRLPPERDLANQFQVSRTTVREAMIALETIGLIEVRVGDGTYVCKTDAGTSAGRIEKFDVSGPSPLEQFRAREAIECAAAADAADNITTAELAELAHCLEEMKKDLDGLTAEATRFKFHNVVAVASRNTIFIKMIRELWEMRSGDMWRTIRDRVVTPAHHVEALQCRVALYEALYRRDRNGAAAAMSQLMDQIRGRFFNTSD